MALETSIQYPAPTMLNARLLLVDDEPAHRRLLTKMLTDAGAQVSIAEDGRTAVEALRRAEADGEPIEAVVMDLEMPVLDGHGAVRMLRRLGYTNPVIAMSAHSESRVAAACFDSGFNAFVPKTGDPARLVGVISKLLGADPSAGSSGSG